MEKGAHQRSESRTIVDKYYSVEFAIEDSVFLYQFKIWNISSQGLCVIVREDSRVLDYIKVGDILDMKYYLIDSEKRTEYLKTEIRHITKDDQGRFKGHYIMGLSILKDQNSGL